METNQVGLSASNLPILRFSKNANEAQHSRYQFKRSRNNESSDEELYFTSPNNRKQKKGEGQKQILIR